MRAAIPDAAGRIDVVDVPKPVPGPGEVVVRVRAAGMNRADLLHAKGLYAQRAFVAAGRPNIAGMEMAGRVVELGSAVDESAGVAPGDAVMAMCAGAYAEYVAVDQRLLLPAPERLTWSECASLPMGLLTEYEAIVRLAEMRVGERALITGATSSVGLLGIQLARLRDPALLAVTSRSAEAGPLLRSLGATDVAQDAGDLAEVAGEDGFDVVVDHVGGEQLESAVRQLREDARVVSVGRLGERSVAIDLTALAGRRARLIGTTWKTQRLAEIATTVEQVSADALPAVRNGHVVAIVSGTVDLENLQQGYESLLGCRPPGKQVVKVSED